MWSTIATVNLIILVAHCALCMYWLSHFCLYHRGISRSSESRSETWLPAAEHLSEYIVGIVVLNNLYYVKSNCFWDTILIAHILHTTNSEPIPSPFPYLSYACLIPIPFQCLSHSHTFPMLVSFPYLSYACLIPIPFQCLSHSLSNACLIPIPFPYLS